MIRSLFILLILFTNCKSNKSTNQIFSKDVMKEILKSVQIIEAKYQHQKVIDSEIASYNLKSNYDSIFSLHEINDSLFIKNLEFYSNNPKMLEEIYKNIINELQIEKQKLP
ncbi:DUF4296 domain-containing protein [Bacteroidota bacterium]|nr:DUF4296 domain-containing protein [Bacteroidota bacterium]MDC3229778.1 DUF4296 domain-containing protein [Bacteroidota bacterium]